MPEQKPFPDRSAPAPRRPKREVVPGKHAQADGLELRSYDVGALPLLKSHHRTDFGARPTLPWEY